MTVERAIEVESMRRKAHLYWGTTETRVAYQNARKVVNKLLGRD